jgi:hypothetical protein
VNESTTLDRGPEYRVRQMDSVPPVVTDRIRALGAIIKGHEDMAAAYKRELKALKREAGIES